MSWRTVVISTRAKLDLQLDSMVVRGETTTKIHISEISILIIENTAVSLTAALLSCLIRNKVKIIFCDEQRNPQSELCPYYGCHDSSAKVKAQMQWNEHFKGELWAVVVKEKINQQKYLLKKKELFSAAEKLGGYAGEVLHKDETNREGHAAKVYFNALFGREFTRADETPINAALNYGYSILLSAINREISANGYLTQLGIHHDNMYNHYNLACDLMEPLRPLVDNVVCQMDLSEFDKNEKLKLIDILRDTVIIDCTEQYMNNAIKIYCRSVFEALNNEDISLVRFFRNEF